MTLNQAIELADFYIKMAKQAKDAGFTAIQSYMVGYADGVRSVICHSISTNDRNEAVAEFLKSEDTHLFFLDDSHAKV